MGLLNIPSLLERIANSLDESRNEDNSKKLKETDFSIHSASEESIIEREDEQLMEVLTNRIREVEESGSRSFFQEDDIKDILEEINEF